MYKSERAGDVQIHDGTVRYTPPTDYLGPDSFTYVITDGKDTDAARVTLRVLPTPEGKRPEPDTDEFEVRLGMESDFFPGMESWLTELHGRADFHYILGSVHWHISEYIDGFWKGDSMEFRKQYFCHLAESAETGLFDALSHPDLVKNFEPDSWDFETIRPVVAEALDRIAVTGVAMELNTSGLRKSYSEMNPGPEMLAMMAERNIPVVVGSDSHVPERVAAHFEDALGSLEQAGFEEVSVFKERQRSDLKIADVKESLC